MMTGLLVRVGPAGFPACVVIIVGLWGCAAISTEAARPARGAKASLPDTRAADTPALDRGPAGLSVIPDETFTAITGEARGRSLLRMRLECVLVARPEAGQYFRSVLGQIAEVVRFVAASRTTDDLRHEAGRARFAREIADNLNAQIGVPVVHSVRMVEFQMTPDG